ncbi:DeSI-like protein [Drosera capensis]
MDSSGSIPVYLNVYDIYSFNGYTYWLGLGVHHSGVQVYGVEYAYGAHQYPTSGIFEGDPKHCEGFTFRRGILIGWTEMRAGQVRKVMEELAERYRGNDYHLIIKNCNHFCNDFCIRLTGNPIPGWVNRLARIGLLCNCLIPTQACTAKFQQPKAEENDAKKVMAEEKKLLDSSGSSSSSPSTPSTTSGSKSKRFRFRSSSSSSSSSVATRSRSAMPSSPLMTIFVESYIIVICRIIP